jgi:hypothetical protein
LRCLKVVKKDFGPVGALHASITKTYLGEKWCQKAPDVFL